MTIKYFKHHLEHQVPTEGLRAVPAEGEESGRHGDGEQRDGQRLGVRIEIQKSDLNSIQ